MRIGDGLLGVGNVRDLTGFLIHKHRSIGGEAQALWAEEEEIKFVLEG